MPLRMGIAAAGDDAGQGKFAAGMQRHRSPLGKSKQDCAFQSGRSTFQLQQAMFQLVDGLGNRLPLGWKQAIPLTPTALGVQFGSVEADQFERLLPGRLEGFPEGPQVVGIGSPAMQ